MSRSHGGLLHAAVHRSVLAVSRGQRQRNTRGPSAQICGRPRDAYLLYDSTNRLKMPPQQLLLSWKDHNGALVSVFENLLKGNTLVDCTLAAEGQYLKAHKIVLSACSSYFELLFSQENEKNPIVILKDVKFQELEAAVNFMYRGEVEVCEDRLAAFLEVADSLQIKGLGSDGKTQDIRPSSPSLKGSKTTVPPKSHSRKEVSFSQSENTGDSCITIDSDKNSKESSSHHHLPHREKSCSSPIPSALASGSSYSLASVSTSGPVRTETDSDGVKVKNNQCSSPSVSIFPSRDTVPSDVNTVVKSEPVTDTYLDEKSNETERDFDDVTMMEDQEDWEDPNLEYMGDDQASSHHDPGFSVTHMKTEESTSAPVEHITSEGAVWVQDSGGDGGGGDRRPPQFASVFFKEHQPGADPGSAPGPAPGPTIGVSSARQGAAGAAGYDADTFGRAAVDPAGVASLRRFPSADAVSVPFQEAFAPLAAFDLHANAPLGTRGGRGRGRGRRVNHTPLRCPQCSFTTLAPHRLVVHSRTHTGEKPYKCPDCGYAGADQANFDRHRRIHTGERPFQCPDCHAAFTQSNSLKRHRRICGAPSRPRPPPPPPAAPLRLF